MAFGYFLDMLYRGALNSILKQEEGQGEKKLFPRLFGFSIPGLLFWLYSTWESMDQEAACKKCFRMYNNKQSVQHGIESGENIPDYNTDF